MTLISFITQTVCPAFLPPADAVDFEYYDVLKLPKSRSTSVTEVRKAYKVLSLQLHPDKIAQKGGNRQEAAALYERVQEAADVLSDDTKRRVYRSYNYSVARYRFVHDQHGFTNPPLLYENFKQASCVDRTRLWCVTTLLLVLVLLQPILIAIKVNSIGNTDNKFAKVSWWYVLMPFWILYSLFIILRSILVALALRDRARFGAPPARPSAALGSVLGVDPAEQGNDGISNYQLAFVILLWNESIALLIGILLLVFQWERPLDQKNDWIYNAIPFYYIVFCIVLRHIFSLQQVRFAQASMRSVDAVRRQNGVDWDEATEEQRAEILQDHIVVHPDPAAFAEAIALYREAQAMEQLEQDVPVLTALDENELESIRIQCSEEYHITEMAKKHYHSSLGNVVVLYVTFIALTTAKLQQKLDDTSWWIIFIPFWVSYGLPFLQYTLICCCGGGVPETEVVITDTNVSGEDAAADNAPDNNSAGVSKGDGNHDASHVSAEVVQNNLTADDAGDVISSPNKDDTELKSSVQWASPDGNMDEFNSPSKTPLPVDGAMSNVAESNVDDSTDEKPVGMDEETFRRFQEHLQEKERQMMEQKAKAFAGCCNICLQLVILCPLVAKLEHDYNAFVTDKNDGIDASDGFNAMWVLFPVFLLSGCVLCLCTCCICVRGDDEALPDDDPLAPSPHTEPDSTATNVPSNHNAVDSVSTNEVMPAKTEPSPATTLSENVSPQADNSVMVHDVETGGGAIDDLD